MAGNKKRTSHQEKRGIRHCVTHTVNPPQNSLPDILAIDQRKGKMRQKVRMTIDDDEEGKG